MSSFTDAITAKTPAYNDRPVRNTFYKDLAEDEPDAIRAILARIERDRIRTFTEPTSATKVAPFNRSAKRVNAVLRDGQGARDATPAERRRGAFGTN